MARLYPVVDRVILVGLCLPLILAAGLFFYTRVNHYIPALRLGYQAALWMSEQLPPEARVASWNAGILGYFSERPVINLDGLINGADYYYRVIKGPVSWEDYVREMDVDYIVDYEKSMVNSPEFPVFRMFVLLSKEDDEVVIWRVITP